MVSAQDLETGRTSGTNNSSNNHDDSSSKSSRILQRVLLVTQTSFSIYLIVLGSRNWNECETVRTLPLWAISFGVVIFSVNVLFPIIFLLQSRDKDEQDDSNKQDETTTNNDNTSYCGSLRGVHHFLSMAVLTFLLGYGAALVYPNVGTSRPDDCEDLFYPSFWIVSFALVGFLLIVNASTLSNLLCRRRSG